MAMSASKMEEEESDAGAVSGRKAASQDSTVSSVPAVSARTVLDLVQDETLGQTIVSFSAHLDQLLGGGLPLARITELCGPPGAGKTQLCLQLAVSVQIPACFGGLQGQCLFIDTEQSFFLKRFEEIARGAIRHCEAVCEEEEQSNALRTFTVESIVNGLHYSKCTDSLHLIALIESLPVMVRSNPKLKLIIVDSLARPMRLDYGDDYSARTRVLAGLAQILIQTAVENKIAIVLTNHMTTRFSADQSLAHLVPSLGDGWGHVCAIRLLLDHETRAKNLNLHSSVREAVILKASSGVGLTAQINILQDGIRDVDPNRNPIHHSDSETMELGSLGHLSNKPVTDSNAGSSADSVIELTRRLNSPGETPPSKRQCVDT